MSKYKPGDKFILELTGIDEIAGREVYLAKGCTGGFSENFLDKLEKAEGVPKKRGEWFCLGGDEWCCNMCGHVISTEGSWEEPDYNFCMNCGADMRKKVE